MSPCAKRGSWNNVASIFSRVVCTVPVNTPVARSNSDFLPMYASRSGASVRTAARIAITRAGYTSNRDAAAVRCAGNDRVADHQREPRAAGEPEAHRRVVAIAVLARAAVAVGLAHARAEQRDPLADAEDRLAKDQMPPVVRDPVEAEAHAQRARSLVGGADAPVVDPRRDPGVGGVDHRALAVDLELERDRLLLVG